MAFKSLSTFVRESLEKDKTMTAEDSVLGAGDIVDVDGELLTVQSVGDDEVKLMAGDGDIVDVDPEAVEIKKVDDVAESLKKVTAKKKMLEAAQKTKKKVREEEGEKPEDELTEGDVVTVDGEEKTVKEVKKNGNLKLEDEDGEETIIKADEADELEKVDVKESLSKVRRSLLTLEAAKKPAKGKKKIKEEDGDDIEAGDTVEYKGDIYTVKDIAEDGDVTLIDQDGEEIEEAVDGEEVKKVDDIQEALKKRAKRNNVFETAKRLRKRLVKEGKKVKEDDEETAVGDVVEYEDDIYAVKDVDEDDETVTLVDGDGETVEITTDELKDLEKVEEAVSDKEVTKLIAVLDKAKLWSELYVIAKEFEKIPEPKSASDKKAAATKILGAYDYADVIDILDEKDLLECKKK